MPLPRPPLWAPCKSIRIRMCLNVPLAFSLLRSSAPYKCALNPEKIVTETERRRTGLNQKCRGSIWDRSIVIREADVGRIIARRTCWSDLRSLVRPNRDDCREHVVGGQLILLADRSFV